MWKEGVFSVLYMRFFALFISFFISANLLIFCYLVRSTVNVIL